eukprot:scaffold6162_cov116-Isochrysis_galbana.AAC.9
MCYRKIKRLRVFEVSSTDEKKLLDREALKSSRTSIHRAHRRVWSLEGVKVSYRWGGASQRECAATSPHPSSPADAYALICTGVAGLFKVLQVFYFFTFRAQSTRTGGQGRGPRARAPGRRRGVNFDT